VGVARRGGAGLETASVRTSLSGCALFKRGLARAAAGANGRARRKKLRPNNSRGGGQPMGMAREALIGTVRLGFLRPWPTACAVNCGEGDSVADWWVQAAAGAGLA
jgi:hypothetical protein